MTRHSLVLVLLLVGCGGSIGAGSEDLIAYEATTADETSSIFVVGPDGNDRRPVTALKPPPVENTVSWGPDGRTILFEGATGGVWLIELESGAFRRIADGWNPEWSPDGERIALVAEDGLAILTADGDHVRTVPLPAAGDADLSSSMPAWSPDGRELAVTLVKPEPHDRWESSIYRISVEGDQAAALVMSAPFVTEASVRWTAHGEEIAFLVSDGHSPPSLWTVPKLGGERRSVERDAAAFAWSPDGRVLAHASGAGEVFIGGRRTAVWAQAYEIVWSVDGDRLAVGGKDGVLVLGADGRERGRIAGFVVSPSFSPDGNRVAVGRDRKVVVSALDGSSAVELTAPTADLSPAWSPDGSRIAFTRSDPDGYAEESRVFVIDADGGDERELGVGLNPQWLPDGRRIVVEAPGAGIVLLDADEGTAMRLAGGEQPAISSDGRRIAFVRYDYRDTEEGAIVERSTLASLSLEDGKVTELAGVTGADKKHFTAPAWLPTGKVAVAVLDLFDGTGHLEVVSLAGERRVVREDVTEYFAWAPDARRLAYVRGGRVWVDDRPLVFDNVVHGPLAWSPDGQEIAFVAHERAIRGEEEAALFVTRADGSGIRRVADAVFAGDPTWRPAQP